MPRQSDAIVCPATPEARLAALGIVLPAPPRPVGNFLTHVRHGDLLFLSGQGPNEAGGIVHRGKVGGAVTAEQAREHARITAINLLSVMKAALDDLSRVRQVVRIFGMVNAVEDFERHGAVIAGCSDLLLDVFGERGRHASTAIGIGALPDNITVEIEAVVSCTPAEVSAPRLESV